MRRTELGYPVIHKLTVTNQISGSGVETQFARIYAGEEFKDSRWEFFKRSRTKSRWLRSQ